MDREPSPKRPRVGNEEENPGVNYPLDLFHDDPRNADLYRESLANPDAFWGDLAKRRIRWMREFEKVKEVDMETGSIKWFLGGQLNVSGVISACSIYPLQLIILLICFFFSYFEDNCLDRHVERCPDRVALIWEKDEPKQHEAVTYK